MRRALLLAVTAAGCLAMVAPLVSAVDSAAPADDGTSRPSGQVLLTHLDDAPPGTDVRAGASTAALAARSGAATRPSTFRLQAPRLTPARGAMLSAFDGSVVSALSVPGGSAVLGGLTEHVAPSCTGTIDGNRVQVVYARETGTASRYREVLPSLLSFVADVDDTFALSSPTSGRRVRWVQDGSCVPAVAEVVVPDGTLTGNSGLSALAAALRAAGHARIDRKYLTFADASTLCGVGHMAQDSDPTSANANNGGVAMYARVDTACWATRADYHSSPAHELMHMLGAVQPDAPHATEAGHCTDESDVMCYEDGSGARMTASCTAPHAEARLDCNNDDYFDTGAPSGYLGSAWNTARSAFLDTVPPLGSAVTSVPVPASTPVTGSVAPTASTPVPVPVPIAPPVAPPVAEPVAPPVAVSATVAISAPRTLYVGATGRVSVSVRAGGVAVATAVSLQQRTATGWRAVASARTSSAGTVAFTVRRTAVATVTVRAVVPASSTITAAGSAAATTRVVRRPTATGAGLKTGRPNTLTATVRTNARTPVAGQYVTLQVRYVGSTAWRTVGRKVSSRLGQAVFAVQPKRPASYRWIYGGSSALAPSTSATSAVSY